MITMLTPLQVECLRYSLVCVCDAVSRWSQMEPQKYLHKWSRTRSFFNRTKLIKIYGKRTEKLHLQWTQIMKDILAMKQK